MGRANQGNATADRTGDGLVNNAAGTRGFEALDADDNPLLRASSDEDGSNPLVYVPVNLSVDGQTTEVEDVVTGDISVEDGSGFVLLSANAVDGSDVVEIDGDLVVTGEISENQTL